MAWKGWERLRDHLERLNAICPCQFVPNEIKFLPMKQYMRKMRKLPVPASLLALEPNLRPAV